MPFDCLEAMRDSVFLGEVRSLFALICGELALIREEEEDNRALVSALLALCTV